MRIKHEACFPGQYWNKDGNFCADCYAPEDSGEHNEAFHEAMCHSHPECCPKGAMVTPLRSTTYMWPKQQQRRVSRTLPNVMPSMSTDYPMMTSNIYYQEPMQTGTKAIVGFMAALCVVAIIVLIIVLLIVIYQMCCKGKKANRPAAGTRTNQSSGNPNSSETLRLLDENLQGGAAAATPASSAISQPEAPAATAPASSAISQPEAPAVTAPASSAISQPEAPAAAAPASSAISQPEAPDAAAPALAGVVSSFVIYNFTEARVGTYATDQNTTSSVYDEIDETPEIF